MTDEQVVGLDWNWVKTNYYLVIRISANMNLFFNHRGHRGDTE
jgi:hypothetical protein